MKQKNMSKYISIDDRLDAFLYQEVGKDENGKREETYTMQLKRLLGVGK
jgi:hypothetical protein